MSRMTRPKIKEGYSDSINQVLQFIDNHLDADLSLESLAEVALFSKYHFHRIFKGAIGESVAAYVIRRRLERAAFLLKRVSELTVTQVALRVGFKSLEHFSRSFKDKFGLTANEFRRADAEAPDSPKNSKIYQEVSERSFYNIYKESREMERVDFEVVVRERPEFTIAYISDQFGEDGTGLVAAYHELLEWANGESLLTAEATRFAISRDDIEITPAEQYRLDFCLSVPAGTAVSGRVGLGKIYGGRYAMIPVQGDIHKVAQAWDYLYKEWLPRSGYRPVDEPAIEVFVQGPEKIGWEQFDLEIGVPIERPR